MSNTPRQRTANRYGISAIELLYGAPKSSTGAQSHRLAAGEKNVSALEHAGDEMQSDRKTVLANVKKDGLQLKYASDELKADKEVVLAAVKQNSLALMFAPNEFRSDREFMLAAVKENGCVLLYGLDELQSDREVVLAAVKEHGSALEHASEEMQSEREIVLAAVKNDGSALKHGSKKLQADREVLLVAVKQCGMAFRYGSQELRSDREFVLAAVNESGSALEHAAREFRSDRELVLAAVKNDGLSLKYASDELKADRDIVLTAVGSCGCALRFCASNLRCDRGVVLAAVMQDKGALQYADESLQSDERLLHEVSERTATARYTSVDARFTLDPSWDAPTAVKFVSEKFAASGKLAWDHDTVSMHPLVGYRISSIELLSNASFATATSALSRMWESKSRHDSALSSEQLAVWSVFDAMLQENGGASMIVFHGCSDTAARSIAEQGFVRSSQRDNGYFGRGIYATPNAEYACWYATQTADWSGAVVMCRACVPSAYFVTRADYDESNAAGHSKLYGQALKSEEAHFALVSRSTNFGACHLERAEYCELCVSQVAALCPLAIVTVKPALHTTAPVTAPNTTVTSVSAQSLPAATFPRESVSCQETQQSCRAEAQKKKKKKTSCDVRRLDSPKVWFKRISIGSYSSACCCEAGRINTQIRFYQFKDGSRGRACCRETERHGIEVCLR